MKNNNTETLHESALEGYVYVGGTQHKSKQELNEEKGGPVSLDVSAGDAGRRLQELVGLERVKQEIQDARLMIKYQRLRHRLDMDTKAITNRHHMLFLGNPGTGKTTVAALIGEMYHSMGILSKGHTVFTNRADLVGEYIGATEHNIKTRIIEARGGVLFIDEAYSLFTQQGDGKDYGKQVVNALLPLLSDNNPDCIVILAGYEDRMEKLISMNQGLKDRFPLHLHFEDFSALQLVQIFHNLCSEYDLSLTQGAEHELKSLFQDVVQNKDEEFSNARWVHNFFEHGVMKAMVHRVMNRAMKYAIFCNWPEYIQMLKDFKMIPRNLDVPTLMTRIEKRDIQEAHKLMLKNAKGNNNKLLHNQIGFV